MSTLHSIGNMNQLADALENAGFTPDDITKLRSFPDLARVKDVLRGYVQIVTVKHIIDLDGPPFVPDGWEVVEHHQGGSFAWDPEKVMLYFSERQKRGDFRSYSQGHDLRKEIEWRHPFNANLLDYLLGHQDLIPKDWKERWIFFWGTIYRHTYGDLCVRCLSRSCGRWLWLYVRLDSGFLDGIPAAVPVRLPT